MNRSLILLGLAAILTSALPTSAQDDAETFTLYRNSVLDSMARIHVATFDARDGEAYNAENCAIVADLMQSQNGVKTRFWCEPGAARA